MFIEPHLGGREKTGWIEVICGCMFSGKTEELIRRLNRALIAQQKVEIFKPAIDRRYHEEKIVSHSERDLRRFCTRGLYLDGGRLKFDGPIGEALDRYNTDHNS